jgi:hypothetical protein
MTEDVLQDVVTAKMSKEAWDSLQQMFSSSILAHTVQICVELATTKKHGLMWAAYYRKNTGLANELAAANAPMKDDDMIAYLLARLPAEYDSFVTLMTTKSTPLTLDDVFTYLMAYEARQLQLQLHHETSADYARRGGTTVSLVVVGILPLLRVARLLILLEIIVAPPLGPCQICGKVRHTTIRCWYRMDDSYQEGPPSATVATTHSYKVDPNWYSDTGTMDHITSDLDRLAVRERYNDSDQVQVDNGAGLRILHTGHSLINTTIRPLALCNILHVPNIFKLLLSVHKIFRDNDIFFNIIVGIFLLRIDNHRKFFCKGDVSPTSTPSSHPILPPLVKPCCANPQIVPNGMLALGTLPLR